MNLITTCTAAFALLAAAAAPAQAQTLIDQAAALAGNVTPGDSPGFPITIDKPGHYVLKGNLTPPINIGALYVTADDVTIDLNGFVIASEAQCSQDLQSLAVSCNMVPVGGLLAERIGILSQGARLTVRNGTVRGFLSHGISGAEVLDNMHIHFNLGSGVKLLNGSAGGATQVGRIQNSQVSLNAGSGVEGYYVLVQGSVIAKNGGHGLWVGAATVRDSVLSYNAGRGINSSANRASSVRGSDLSDNKTGATAGGVVSLGGNFNGTGAF